MMLPNDESYTEWISICFNGNHSHLNSWPFYVIFQFTSHCVNSVATMADGLAMDSTHRLEMDHRNLSPAIPGVQSVSGAAMVKVEGKMSADRW